MIKTNVMRILDKAKINYEVIEYNNEITNGEEVASLLRQDSKIVFKTLVTVAKSKEHYVFMIPVNKELDLKKCAKVTNEKSIEMIHQKELLSLTGYIHGGCSPLGMKKVFKTFINESIKKEEVIYFSAGKVGLQIKMNPNDLIKVLSFEFKDLVKD